MKGVGWWPSDGWWARWQILWHVRLCCVTGHAIRPAMGTVWETWRVWLLWTGCVMGGPSGITSHHVHNTIWSHLFQGPLAFKTQQNTWPPAPSLHPAPTVNAPCSDALSTAIDSFVSGHWHYSWMTSTPWIMPLLMLYMSSNIDLHNDVYSYKRGAPGKE